MQCWLNQTFKKFSLKGMRILLHVGQVQLNQVVCKAEN